MNRTRILLVVFLCANLQVAMAQEWAQWRGPNRDGVVSSFLSPASWPKALTLKWKTAVGGGYSSPLLAGTRVYIHTRQDDNEVVQCLDLASGKSLWRTSYPAPFAKNQYAVKMGKGPNSTPVLYRDKLYTLGVTAVLSCFDAKSGALKWRKDYSKQIDTSKLFCGTAMSPVIENGMVIAHVGDDRQGWLVAFDAETGNERWKWEGDGPGYASPIVAELEGARQVVTLTDKSVIAVAADSGKLLWKMPFPDEWNENIVTPVLYKKTLIVSGVRQGTRALKITRAGDKWTATELWHNPKIAMYMSSPVLDGDYLYGLSHLRKGQFFCLDARTGELVWATEGREGANAAVLNTGKHLVFLTDDADLIVANKSAKGFESVAKYQTADSPTWAHPVIWGKQILIKDESS
ncbi:MAG TPA: PQQ-binding-like beta-propeller repeat protein, partial [Blastocatellia bacterium]|nr:PQQ-binding-like beta-propeller repeat protein [Blastocatellia bacterium]